MKAVITVTGKDTVGIIADVANVCAKHNANILDITQSVLGEYFAMIMLVDLDACPLPFHELQNWLHEKGQERLLYIHIQRSDIFEAMHRI